MKYFGLTSSGSQRWINLYVINLQPSELMKIGLILFLAKYYHRIPFSDVNKFRFLFFPIICVTAPALLVISQPDLGTAILIVAGGIIVAWLAGIKFKFFAYISIIFLALAPIAISFLKPYQKERILTFLNPDRDPLGAGYQIIQSKIAIGSGGIFGKGYLLGSQSRLNYLPEKHTDFIFTLISEEFGFLGSISIILLFSILVILIMKISFRVVPLFSKVVVFGIGFLLFLYLSLNIGMVCGLLPVVGAPLPLISYGGTSLLTMLIGIGIVLSINVHDKNIL